MAKLKLDHFYLSVKDLKRAVSFYEDLLNLKVTHLEEDSWADFDLGEGVYFGLIHAKYINEGKRVVGNNGVAVFFADNVREIFEKVKKYNLKIVSEPEELAYTEYHYECFQFEDPEGNLVEIANYDLKKLKNVEGEKGDLIF